MGKFLVMTQIRWMDKPEEHDYAAAESFLSLLFTTRQARKISLLLGQAPISKFFAKDITRASGLELLTKKNIHVHEDLEKIEQGKKLSPILLVRGSALTNRALIVADGYHRSCASYIHDENSRVPCKIVDLPGKW